MIYPLNPIKEKSRKRSKRFATWDIETVKWVNFLCVGVYDGKEFRCYKSLIPFLKYCFQKYNGWEMYSHFGGKFDDLFLLKAVLAYNARSEVKKKIEISPIIPRGSGIFSFDLDWDGMKLTFLDSSALLPFSLKKITKEFGVTHEKLEIDYTRIRKITKKLIRYLKHDVMGLYEAIEKFRNWPLNKKAGSAPTIASQSLKVLRTFIDEPIAFLQPEIDKEVRQAYFGGRVEIFKPAFSAKKRKIYCYDVNSLYPFIMRNHEYPNHYIGHVKRYIPNHFGIYDVIAHVPEMHIPPLPKIRKGKLIFPVGTFHTRITSNEIEYAETLGCKFEIREGWLFSNGGYIFKNFVDSLYRIKAKSERGSVNNTISKLLMNSCYGKFGQRRDREQIVFDNGEEGLRDCTGWANLLVGDKNFRLMLKSVDIDCYSNVAIAAMVTANARIYMHDKMLRSGEVYYTDTDSIFTSRKMRTSERLGGMKLESESSNAIFLLPKTYIAGEKIVMKGFEKKKLKEITLDDFQNGLRGDTEGLKISVEPKFANFRTAVRNGDLTMLTNASTRQIRSRYDKRILIREGEITKWKTKPIKLRMKK